MPRIPHLLLLLLLFSAFLVTEAQLRSSKANLSDVTGETNLKESRRRDELDKKKNYDTGMWEGSDGRMKAKKELMWEKWEGRMKAKKEMLETQKVERCLLQGDKIIITGSKIRQYRFRCWNKKNHPS